MGRCIDEFGNARHGKDDADEKAQKAALVGVREPLITACSPADRRILIYGLRQASVRYTLPILPLDSTILNSLYFRTDTFPPLKIENV